MIRIMNEPPTRKGKPTIRSDEHLEVGQNIKINGRKFRITDRRGWGYRTAPDPVDGFLDWWEYRGEEVADA